jgi:Flp pilus assembly protein TadB
MKIEEPPADDLPKSHNNSPPSASGAAPSKFHSGSFFATQAEREDAEQEATLMSQIRSSKSKSKSKSKKDGSKASSKNKTKQKPIVVEEIDLERYGCYGSSSSREGEKLPGITRAGLKTLFWGFRLLVWVLSFIAKSVAWLLVSSTRCLTSERF